VTNNTSGQVRIHQANTAPTSEENLLGFPVWPGQSVTVQGNAENNFHTYIKGSTSGYIIVQQLSSTVLPVMNAELAHDILTSGKQGFRRLQIEEGQTGFFEGRGFRSLVKIRLSSGGIVSYKFSCTEAFILEQLRFAISSGNYEVHIWSSDNVEETVISSTPVPIFNKNLSDERRTDYAGPGGFMKVKQHSLQVVPSQ
jgi:hypothetical protein